MSGRRMVLFVGALVVVAVFVLLSLFATRVRGTYEHLVSPSELALVERTFQENDLSMEDLQVTRVHLADGEVVSVRVQELYQGLRISGKEKVYYFLEELEEFGVEPMSQ